MDKPELIKNIAFSEAHVLADLADSENGRVANRTFAQKAGLSLTHFAFDEGEELSTHAPLGDAVVQVLEGEASLTIGGNEAVANVRRWLRSDLIRFHNFAPTMIILIASGLLEGLLGVHNARGN